MTEKAEEKGRVTLVGAGPGDPGLMTMKGRERIEHCDVLVYDNLMADEFIALSSAKEKIFVGKSSGRHALPQEQINQLLVDKAAAGNHVVRIKGGDPFVFGRGGEECELLAKSGIPYEIVPGPTAGIAGTAYAGIPVTHRELSRGVTFCTAHFAKDKHVELPWKSLAGLGHTLVFYMGVASAAKVCERLIENGLDAKTPAAAIQRATTGAQREVVSDVEHLAGEMDKAMIRPPAIIVIGEVVRLRDTLTWLPDRPLAGKGVMFTRAAESEYDAVRRLRELGAEVLDVPVVTAVPRRDDPLLKTALGHLDDYACIAFTSALGVDIFFSAMHEAGLDVRRLSGHKLAAASPTVIRALKERGVVADLVAHKAGAGQLVKLIAEHVEPGAQILLPRSSAADAALPAAISEAGYTPVPVAVYDSRRVDLSWLDVKLANWKPDAVVFLSGTGVRYVLEAAPQLMEKPYPLWACVGQKTAESLPEHGLKADIIPERTDVDSLVNAVIARLLPGV